MCVIQSPIHSFIHAFFFLLSLSVIYVSFVLCLSFFHFLFLSLFSLSLFYFFFLSFFLYFLLFPPSFILSFSGSLNISISFFLSPQFPPAFLLRHLHLLSSAVSSRSSLIKCGRLQCLHPPLYRAKVTQWVLAHIKVSKCPRSRSFLLRHLYLPSWAVSMVAAL